MSKVSQNSARGANNSAQPNTLLDEQNIRAAMQCSNTRCECQRADGNVHCPAHDDKNPSLSVGTNPNGHPMFRCHAGCEQGAVFNAVRDAVGQSRPTPPKPSQNAVKSPANARFDWEGATIYVYTDETGEPLFEVGRTGTGAAKSISQRKPNGRGGYFNKLGDVRRVLYRLPDVLDAQFVIVCEGEKAADAVNAALEAAGLLGEYIATTNPHGGGKWRDEFAVELNGKTVCVLPDNDKPGRDHADDVCPSCSNAGAVVKRVELPELPAKGDAADFLASGGTVEQIIELLKVAPTWTPQPPAQRFPRSTLSEIFARPRLEYLLQGMFVEIGTGVISADYGGFKSFIALDMGLCIATGRAWMGRATKRGNVVYVTPEGAYTVADRVKAWMIRHNVTELPENFEIIELPVQLADATQRALLIDELRELNPNFIIFDTVAKCNVGRDENDNAAMGEFTHGMEEVSRELNAFVLAIHHNNKQGGTRGAISLPANVDASVTLKRSPGRIVTLHCDRVKGAPFDDFSLIGRIVEIGEVDENGAQITSLVFEPTDTPTSAIPQSDQTRERILRALETAGPNGLTATQWQDKAGVGRSTLAEHRAALVEEKRVQWNGKIYKIAIMSGTSGTSGTDMADTKNTSAMSGSTLVPDVADIPAKKRRAKNNADAEPYKAPEIGGDDVDGDLI